MRDAIGNRIQKEDICALSFDLQTFQRLTYTVTEVSDGVVTIPGERPIKFVAFHFVVPVNHEGAGEAFLESVRCLRNPRSEGLLDALSNTERPQ